MWFYVKTPGTMRTLEDESTETMHPYASRMREMKPLSKVDTSSEILEECISCDKAFTLACRYSGGRDLVEEMVSSDFWPLGHRNEDFTIKMVGFWASEGTYPRFGRMRVCDSFRCSSKPREE